MALTTRSHRVLAGSLDEIAAREIDVLLDSGAGGKVPPTFNVMLYGAKGDGVTDDLSAISAAMAAASSHGGTVYFPGYTFAIGGVLPGTYSYLHLVGEYGKTSIIRLATGSNVGILSGDSGTYTGYTFEGITFLGNSVACLAAGLTQATINLYQNAIHVAFRNCIFRDMTNYLTVVSARFITFDKCTFYGTTSGVMQSGVQSPNANSSASWSRGVQFGKSVYDVLVKDCRFHFCWAGVNANGTTNQPSDRLRIVDSNFRYDWWDAPYIWKRIVPTAYNTGTRVLTYATGGFTGMTAYQSFSFQVPIASDTAFANSGLFNGIVTAKSALFGSARIGDVFETADGRRAEITAIVSTTQVYVSGWESIDTYESTTPPSIATAWRLSRYYASTATIVDDQNVTLYCDPVNVFTGERLVGDAGLSPVGLNVRIFSMSNYSGVQVNWGYSHVSVSGCYFRGSWADQCSIFNSQYMQVTGCRFEYGQDEGITCQGSDHAVLSNNTFHNGGTSGIAIYGSNYCSAVGNTFYSWGQVNRANLGAAEGWGKCITFVGNSCSVMPGTGFGGGSAYLFNFYSASGHTDSSGSVVAGNTDGGALVATLNVGTGAAGSGMITARDLLSVTGDVSGLKSDTGIVAGGGSTAAVDPWFLGTGGGYYFPTVQTNATSTNASLGNGTLRAMPCLVSKTITITRIGAEVTVIGDAASVVRLGIYNDNGSGFPGTLLLDAGTISGNSATYQEIAINQSLSAGTYWFCAVIQGVTSTQPTLRTNTTSPYSLGRSAAPDASHVTFLSYTMSSITGALTSPFSTSPASDTNAVRIYVKVT